MSATDFSKLLSLDERAPVEHKPSAENPEELGAIVCGFLNTRGGYVVCGVNGQGKPTNMGASPREIEKIERLFSVNISPKAFVVVQTEQLPEGKSVILIEVPKGKDAPYSFKDVIYTRSADRTEEAGASTIRELVREYQIEPERWERHPSLADSNEDIDEAELRATVKDVEKTKRALFRDLESPFIILEDLSVTRYGQLTNAGDVLFANNPAARQSQIHIRARCYKSDKAGDTYLDMKSFEGPLCRIFEEAYIFIVRNTATISRFSKDSPRREDTPIYPEEAVREALINALAHRDYSASFGGVAIDIYPRRLEIWNSGALPDGVTEESLKSGRQISVLRNPDIARVLHMRDLMEKAGRGSRLMAQKCRDRGLPAPVWESNPQLGVKVTFQTAGAALEIAGEVKRLLRSMKGRMGRRELQNVMKLKDKDYFRTAYIQPALKMGLIERTIPDKPKSRSQKYRLTSEGEKVLESINS